MDEYEWKTEVIPIFPFVSFTNVDGRKYCIPRERIIHTETYVIQGAHSVETLTNKTYVRFVSPDPKSKGPLFAIVDMPVEVFRDTVIRPAYEGSRDTTR